MKKINDKKYKTAHTNTSALVMGLSSAFTLSARLCLLLKSYIVLTIDSNKLMNLHHRKQ